MSRFNSTQHARIIRTGASLGFSPWFLLLGVSGALANLVNILILQWHVVACCSHHPSWSACAGNTLGIAQLGIQYIQLALLFILFLAYYPRRHRYVVSEDRHSEEIALLGQNDHAASIQREWKQALYATSILVLYHLCILSIVTYLYVGSVDASGRKFRVFASLLGILSAAIAITQYVPQLIKTYTTKDPGALSILMMLMQTPGSFLLVYALASKPGTNWTTWITYLTSATMQGILLVMCVMYRKRQRRIRLAAERADGRVTPAGIYWEDIEEEQDDEDPARDILDADLWTDEDDADHLPPPRYTPRSSRHDSDSYVDRLTASERIGVFVSPIGSYVESHSAHPSP